MSLSDEQYAFALDKILLEIKFKMSNVITKFTLGDSYRSYDEQVRLYNKGYTQTLASQHAKRKAQDYNFWVDGKYAMDFEKSVLFEALRPFGEYWESLSHKNKWGGFFDFFDPGHFERGE